MVFLARLCGIFLVGFFQSYRLQQRARVIVDLDGVLGRQLNRVAAIKEELDADEVTVADQQRAA